MATYNVSVIISNMINEMITIHKGKNVQEMKQHEFFVSCSD